jgi:hypothetical protein
VVSAKALAFSFNSTVVLNRFDVFAAFNFHCALIGIYVPRTRVIHFAMLKANIYISTKKEKAKLQLKEMISRFFCSQPTRLTTISTLFRRRRLARVSCIYRHDRL